MLQEENVMKLLHKYQNTFGESVQSRLRQRVDMLTGYMKEMRVSYIIVKKLELHEEYLEMRGIKEHIK